jgi:hypothetical protein
VIGGYRSPMWPNSSKRAAVFPLHHVYARLFLGIFDINGRKANEPDYFCGRIAIDIPQLRANPEYDVTFPVRVSSFVYDRRPCGVVRVLFSLHWLSERAIATPQPSGIFETSKEAAYHTLWRSQDILHRCRHCPWTRLSRKMHASSISCYHA